MPELMIAHLFEPMEEGTIFNRWPLHMSLLPWFNTEQVAIIQTEFEALAARQEKIRVAVGDLAIVGTIRKKQAQLLELTPELELLHESILDIATPRGTIRPTEPVGDDYTPHVVKRETRILRPSGIVTIDAMSVIGFATDDARDGMKILLKTYGFGREEQA
jgi:hypothetical protein